MDNPDDDVVFVGYAADGFKMYSSESDQFKPSYKLKDGTRPSGPGGEYDGTYTQDFEYVDGLGDLDDCNGREYNGQYSYFITDNFPFVPRCWKGMPDQGFERHPGMGKGGEEMGMRPPPRGRADERDRSPRPPRGRY
jgi:hypothetical protein